MVRIQAISFDVDTCLCTLLRWMPSFVLSNYFITVYKPFSTTDTVKILQCSYTRQRRSTIRSNILVWSYNCYLQCSISKLKHWVNIIPVCKSSISTDRVKPLCSTAAKSIFPLLLSVPQVRLFSVRLQTQKIHPRYCSGLALDPWMSVYHPSDEYCSIFL